MRNLRNLWLLCILAFVIIGCGLNDQSAEANKINDETNTLIVKYNENNGKKVDLYNKLLSENLKGVTDVKAYKEKNSAEFDELVQSIESQLKLSKETVDKYSPIVKLDVPEKYKEYASANLAVHEKRVEADQAMLDYVKSFLETDDIDKVNKMIGERDTQMGKLDKEIEELGKKAEQIQKDNPSDIDTK